MTTQVSLADDVSKVRLTRTNFSGAYSTYSVSRHY